MKKVWPLIQMYRNDNGLVRNYRYRWMVRTDAAITRWVKRHWWFR